jgi:hypothetical protein
VTFKDLQKWLNNVQSNSTSNTNLGRDCRQKDSLSGTRVNRSLQQTINDPDPNEEANLRSQNMRILRTETTYPESGRKVVKTYDE